MKKLSEKAPLTYYKTGQAVCHFGATDRTLFLVCPSSLLSISLRCVRVLLYPSLCSILLPPPCISTPLPTSISLSFPYPSHHSLPAFLPSPNHSHPSLPPWLPVIFPSPFLSPLHPSFPSPSPSLGMCHERTHCVCATLNHCMQAGGDIERACACVFQPETVAECVYVS